MKTFISTSLATLILFSTSVHSEEGVIDEDVCLAAGMALATNYEQLQRVNGAVDEGVKEYQILVGRYNETENKINEALNDNDEQALTNYLEISSTLYNQINVVREEVTELDTERKVLIIEVVNATNTIKDNSCEEYLGME